MPFCQVLSVKARRVGRNSQWGAVLGVWGCSPQPPEAQGSRGRAPASAQKFCIFLQEITFRAILIKNNCFKAWYRNN